MDVIHAEMELPTASRATMSPVVFVGWGLGSFTTAVLQNSVTLLHMRFMTDSLGIAAAVAGAIIAISKIYNAFIDPAIGMLSDRTQSRWGRRRPYLFLGAFGCAAAMVLLFNVPHFESQQALLIYMAFVLLFYNSIYAVFRTPYLALPAEITETFAERSRLTTFNVYGNSLGTLFATSLAPFLLAYMGSNREAHGYVALILGALILAAGLGCFYATGAIPPVRVQYTAMHTDWRSRWRALVENKPFLVLISFKVVMFLGYFTHTAAIPYYTRHGLRLSDTWIASVYLARTLTTIASQPFWSWIACRIGRRNTLLAAAVTEMLCFMVWFFVTPENAALAIVPVGLVQGLASGGLFFGLYTALPDTMEYDRRRSGLQREGVFAGIFVMVEKFVAAIASGMFGVTIGLLGYLEGKDAVATVQPHSAVQGIFIALSVVPTLLALGACFILRYYRLEDADLRSTSLQPA